ncbi:MAG TPA: TonB family protein [Candidatus Sulfotelmatobacter sp.]|nr:TonB family protein [Candidatus Sulfotelmatobacter sp.]
MIGALALLLMALGLLLYKDRDFWFPDETQADELSNQPAPTAAATPAAPALQALVVATAAPTTDKKHSASKPQLKESAQAEPAVPPVATVTRRTVLPPLEVEVVAGDIHRTVHPGTNSVHVDLQPGSPPRPVTEAADAADTAASLSNAAEHVQMSADTAEVVSRPVKPGYPLLARQMKVQGSVILQALIGKDGLIQNLRVVSGPPILAGAAEEAVKQWHFKPHYQGTEAVETQAKITVNFTISTN